MTLGSAKRKALQITGAFGNGLLKHHHCRNIFRFSERQLFLSEETLKTPETRGTGGHMIFALGIKSQTREHLLVCVEEGTWLISCSAE